MSDGHHRGTCFGYAVRSSMDFEYLRGGGAGDVLEIRPGSQDGPGPDGRLLVEWKPLPGKPFLDARLYGDGSCYRLWINGAGGGWFEIRPEGPSTIGVPPTGDCVRREERIWGVPAMLCFLARGDLPLHAAAVEVNGAAVLLAAPSQFGKTTLAAAFAAHGHRVLSEDLCCLRVGASLSVLPGPAMLRLRHDVAAGLGFDNWPVIGRDADRVHVALPDATRGSCEPVPVRAAVFLRETSVGLELTRMGPAEVLPDLWALSFRLPTHADRLRCFEGIVRLADEVPVWNLARPVRFDALTATVERVVAHA
jgi:hypothetical protein